jgi:hypothetical protein
VQAQNGAGTSNWSLVRSFTVQNSACFGEFGPAGAIKIVEVHHRVGFPAYFRIRNTHPSCPVNLKALYVFDNSVPGFGYFYEMSLWDRWLNPGAELLGGNPAGRSLEHLSVPYSGPNDQRYLGLCLGRCIYDDSSNVTDAVVLALPNVPPPIFGVSMDTPLTRPVRNDFQSFVRVAFNGAAPVFSNADWTLGPATATPCRASLATGQTCDVPFNGYAGMVCQSPSRSCTCTETARDVYTWICAP